MSSTSITDNTIAVARENHVKSSVEGEVVLLDIEAGVYYGLNEVGAEVWDLIQEPQTVEEIVDALLDKYTVERERCMADVIELLEELNHHGLVNLR
mgnify:CR=1 FL=1